MFELVPFKREHLEPLMVQKINAFLPQWIRDGQADLMEKTYSQSIIVEGEVMGCGGIIEFWRGRGQLWALFNERSGIKMMSTFRAIQRFIETATFKRIEIAVPYELAVGHKRARLLGFKLECEKAECYLSNGGAASLYSRIK